MNLNGTARIVPMQKETQMNESDIRFPEGETVARLGQGTWMMGEDPSRRSEEIASLRRGLDLGLTLIDTAEMYGDGASEEMVGEAIRGRREEVFLVSKAYPQNASEARLADACRRSLKRLGTDRLDLYLLHWRGAVPLGETAIAMERLKRDGLIRNWGVSNLDTDDMEELMAVDGFGCQTDQVLYNLTRRGVEWDLLPWLSSRGIPAMAYSPIEQGRLLDHPEFTLLAESLSLSPARLALAWLLERPGVIPIPKAGSVAHVEDNAGALEVRLDEETRTFLDTLFPPPTHRTALEMI